MQTSSPLVQGNTMRFKGHVPSNSFSPLFLHIWDPDIKDWNILKQQHIWQKLENDHICPLKGEGSERTQENLRLHLRLIHGTETTIKKNTNDKQSNKINKNSANAKERGNYNFKSYYIIKFKCIVFDNNNKIIRLIKRQKIWPIQGKKLNQYKLYLRNTWW